MFHIYIMYISRIVLAIKKYKKNGEYFELIDVRARQIDRQREKDREKKKRDIVVLCYS